MWRKTGKYTNPVEFGHLMSIAEFKESVADGLFIDYDGFGYAVKDNLEDVSMEILPSKMSRIPEDATHVNWYNK